MTKRSVRLLAWLMLLISAAVSVAAGLELGQSQEMTSFLIRSRAPGPTANWILFLLAISIACCVYVLRGIESGRWKMSLVGVLCLIGAASALVLFGLDGLVGIGVVSAIVAPFIIRKRSVGPS